jgi:hypothetical protein
MTVFHLLLLLLWRRRRRRKGEGEMAVQLVKGHITVGSAGHNSVSSRKHGEHHFLLIF